MATDYTMPLGEHLEDLRKRLVLALLGLVPIVVIALYFGQQLLELMLLPLQAAMRDARLGNTLQATAPLETFMTYVKVSFIAAIAVGSPWLLYQLWKFVSPGLYSREKRFVYLLIPLSVTLTASAIAFLYFVIIPVILAFFINFGASVGALTTPVVPSPEGAIYPTMPVLAGDPPAPVPGQQWINTEMMKMRICVGIVNDKPEILSADLHSDAGIVQQYRVSEYTGFVLSLALAFSLGFQLPVVVLLLGWAGIIDRAFLAKHRKQAVFICAIAAAVLTPADPSSMVLLWVPLVLLYELGGLLLKFFPAERVATSKFLGGSDPKPEGDDETP